MFLQQVEGSKVVEVQICITRMRYVIVTMLKINSNIHTLLIWLMVTIWCIMPFFAERITFLNIVERKTRQEKKKVARVNNGMTTLKCTQVFS